MARLSPEVLESMKNTLGHISLIRKEGYEEVRYSVGELVDEILDLRKKTKKNAEKYK